MKTTGSNGNRLLLRSSGLFALGLHKRIVMTSLELMLRLRNRRRARQVYFGHQDSASLVGASRPRVTEHPASLSPSIVCFASDVNSS
jgi:hypothetical protein